ncbi:MAG TPA: methionyl-tRNA formyltransferase [Candidatus Limnocylindrales bacterium]|nr:methionyl-tRNA formyltransferase [Candidatus Limnocylindrales bacterium]
MGDRNAISSESPAPATTAANRVRTVFLGSGRFAQPILGRLAAHPSVDVVGVVTAPPRPTGRRQLKTPTPVETTARELGIAVMTPERLRDTAAIADILGLEPTLLVLADYGQIVPDELLEAPDGALNLHPSLLPRHRGATPIPAAILEGDEETGVSLMRMDSGLDTGPLIAIERVSLAGDETTPALEARLAIVAAGLLARSLDGWLAGTLPALPQAARGTTMTRPLRREDGRLDPSDPAWLLERRIRAYLPWPGSFLEAGRDRLVVLVGSVAESEPDDVPGTIVADARGLALATSEGRLILDEVQPAGARPMSGEAFLRGRPSILGASVRPPGPEPRADATASGATAAAVDDRDPAGEPA